MRLNRETRWMVTESTHLCARINDCADACESAERTGSRESGGSGSEQPIDRMLEQVNAAMEGELAATVQRNEAALLVLEQVEWVMHVRILMKELCVCALSVCVCVCFAFVHACVCLVRERGCWRDIDLRWCHWRRLRLMQNRPAPPLSNTSKIVAFFMLRTHSRPPCS